MSEKPLFTPSREQWDRITSKVVDDMRQHTFPYTAAISREISANEGEHLGSGSYLQLRGAQYLLTNEHVARHINLYPLGHQLTKDGYAARMTNALQVARSPYDLALTRIDSHIWSDAKNQRLALPIERLAEKHNPAENELLFTMGYAGDRSRFIENLETLFTKATPYLTQESKSPPGWISSMCFALPYAPDRARSLDPKGAGLPIPLGFSGSPVWNTNFRRCNLENRRWDASRSEVTGIVFKWDKSSAHIIAVRIEHVREFLLYAVRAEASYFHWIDRGRPYGDDLTDWVWAERLIPSLQGRAEYPSITSPLSCNSSLS